MDSDQLRGRITDQFSYHGERADIWRAFDLLLNTDAFLNLGYSEWYQPHILGSCQKRLATKVGTTLSTRLPTTDEVRLLDVGCGRGGPAIHLANRFGFRVTGLDLVPYNITQATTNAKEQRTDAEFVVGDGTLLPFMTESFTACTAIDSLVYLSNREAVFAAIADILVSGGIVVLSDLVMHPEVSDKERRFVSSFADMWDMPPLGTGEEYKQALNDTSIHVTKMFDITQHSVGRFRKWTTLFLWIIESPMQDLAERLLRSNGLAPSIIEKQVRRAHDALPYLQHVILVGENNE